MNSEFGMRSKVRKEAERDAQRLIRATFRDGFAVALSFLVPREAMRIRLKSLGMRAPDLAAA